MSGRANCAAPRRQHPPHRSIAVEIETIEIPDSPVDLTPPTRRPVTPPPPTPQASTSKGPTSTASSTSSLTQGKTYATIAPNVPPLVLSSNHRLLDRKTLQKNRALDLLRDYLYRSTERPHRNLTDRDMSSLELIYDVLPPYTPIFEPPTNATQAEAYRRLIRAMHFFSIIHRAGVRTRGRGLLSSILGRFLAVVSVDANFDALSFFAALPEDVMEQLLRLYKNSATYQPGELGRRAEDYENSRYYITFDRHGSERISYSLRGADIVNHDLIYYFDEVLMWEEAVFKETEYQDMKGRMDAVQIEVLPGVIQCIENKFINWKVRNENEESGSIDEMEGGEGNSDEDDDETEAEEEEEEEEEESDEEEENPGNGNGNMPPVLHPLPTGQRVLAHRPMQAPTSRAEAPIIAPSTRRRGQGQERDFEETAEEVQSRPSTSSGGGQQSASTSMTTATITAAVAETVTTVASERSALPRNRTIQDQNRSTTNEMTRPGTSSSGLFRASTSTVATTSTTTRMTAPALTCTLGSEEYTLHPIDLFRAIGAGNGSSAAGGAGGHQGPSTPATAQLIIAEPTAYAAYPVGTGSSEDATQSITASTTLASYLNAAYCYISSTPEMLAFRNSLLAASRGGAGGAAEQTQTSLEQSTATLTRAPPPTSAATTASSSSGSSSSNRRRPTSTSTGTPERANHLQTKRPNVK